MKQTIKYQRASILRRISSSIFDLIIMIIIFALFQSFIVSPLVNVITDYDTLVNTYNQINLNTHLVIIDNTTGSDVLKLVNNEHDKYLIEFYNDNDLGYSLSDYNNLKKDAKLTYNDKEYFLFTFDNASLKYIETTHDNETINSQLQAERTTFYTNLIVKLYGEVFEKNVDLAALSRKIVSYKYLSWTVSLFVSVTITFLLFPMIFKDRATLGKKMFRFQVVNDANGQIIGRFQTFARFIYFTILYVALISFCGMMISLAFGLLVFTGASIVSIVLIFATKKRQTLHDIISHSVVVNVDFNVSQEDKNDIIEITYDDGKVEDYLEGNKEEIEG